MVIGERETSTPEIRLLELPEGDQEPATNGAHPDELEGVAECPERLLQEEVKQPEELPVPAPLEPIRDIIPPPSRPWKGQVNKLPQISLREVPRETPLVEEEEKETLPDGYLSTRQVYDLFSLPSTILTAKLKSAKLFPVVVGGRRYWEASKIIAFKDQMIKEKRKNDPDTNCSHRWILPSLGEVGSAFCWRCKNYKEFPAVSEVYEWNK